MTDGKYRVQLGLTAATREIAEEVLAGLQRFLAGYPGADRVLSVISAATYPHDDQQVAATANLANRTSGQTVDVTQPGGVNFTGSTSGTTAPDGETHAD